MKLPRILTSTSRRVLLLVPTLVTVEQARARRPVHLNWVWLMVWGFLQYRLSGNYRTAHGGGGPGLSNPPERIVDTGIYRFTRNPMYLGHQINLLGLTLTTRSPLALAALAFHVPWFHRRAARDEVALADLFGKDYERYRKRVPRWLPSPFRACRAG